MFFMEKDIGQKTKDPQRRGLEKSGIRHDTGGDYR